MPVALFFEPALPTLTMANYAGLAYLGLIGAAFTYLLWFRGLSRLEPSAVAPLGFLSPVVAILLGWGVLDERLTPVQALGILVVLISVWLSQRAQLAPRVRPARA
ncbi:O-acetylserine/cysteine export protein [compost metagenome]